MKLISQAEALKHNVSPKKSVPPSSTQHPHPPTPSRRAFSRRKRIQLQREQWKRGSGRATGVKRGPEEPLEEPRQEPEEEWSRVQVTMWRGDRPRGPVRGLAVCEGPVAGVNTAWSLCTQNHKVRPFSKLCEPSVFTPDTPSFFCLKHFFFPFQRGPLPAWVFRETKKKIWNDCLA